jgi:hypothetical protein
MAMIDTLRIWRGICDALLPKIAHQRSNWGWNRHESHVLTAGLYRVWICLGVSRCICAESMHVGIATACVRCFVAHD